MPSRRYVPLLTESADVRGFADDDVLDGVQQLDACGVGGQVQHLAQRVELEHVVMVSGAGRRTRSEIVSAADSRSSGHRAFREVSFWDPRRCGGNIPRQPVEHVVGSDDRDIQVVEDNREAHCSVGNTRERKSRANVAAAAGVPFRDDASVLEGVGFHEQRRNDSVAAPSASAAASAPSRRLSGDVTPHRRDDGAGQRRSQQRSRSHQLDLVTSP